MKELGIYVHIPFCVSKCYYCNFNSYSGIENLIGDYINALISEIVSFSKNATNYNITTIYIGGGTPSCVDAECVSKILTAIKQNYLVDNNCEISIEANPNSITFDKAKAWKSAGINRVSVGLQSSNDNILQLINRSHCKNDYINAIKALKKAKFNNINTDIMLGLPTQSLLDVKNTLSLVLKNKVNHISAYSLILEENTKLYDMVNSGEIKLPKEDNVIKMYDYVVKCLKLHKFERYEVSNFCLKNMQCKHNVNCWNMVEYVGFGVGANSFVNNKRWGNILSVQQYIEKINNKTSVYEFNEEQVKEQLFDEYVMLMLRTAEGLDLNRIKSIYNKDLLLNKSEEIENLLKHKLIKIKNNHLFATNTGFKVLNQIILDLVY